MRQAVIALFLAACGRVNFEAGNGDAPGGEAPLTYRDAVLADDPVSYWRLSDTNATIADQLGRNPGTLLGTCTLAAPGLLSDDPDTAITFDGATCAVDLGDTLLFTSTAPWSIEAWVRWDGGDVFGTRQHVFTRQARNAGPVDGYAIVMAEGIPTGFYAERVIGAANFATDHVVVTADQIVHVVVTYDGAALEWFANGASQQLLADSRPMNPFTANAYIGWGLEPTSPPRNFFAGVIDEVAVYDHALADNRITLHYDIGVNGPR